MKLTRLDLDRYGPFTDARLAFRPEADLHIVYGPNEAGKSSALSAITDLLYGFEPRSPANFRHRYEDLKIGAEMLRADGAVSRFWRRKRLRNSLTDGVDAPLDEGLLDGVLSGISREVFLAAFGLDQAGLREGARQMLAAQGEVGESLFAAASGLKTMLSVRSGLEGEADGLFGSRKSSKRAFYEAQERYDQARRALREQSLRADDVRALEDQIGVQEAQVLALAEQLRQSGIKRARIDRVRRVAPLLARLEQATRALEDLRDLPDLPEGFAAEIETALSQARTGGETLARLSHEAGQAEQGLAAIQVDDNFLAQAEAIAALNEERASLAKAMQDLQRREVEARDLVRDLDDLARRLGQPGRHALARLRPDDLALERLRALAERRRQADVTSAENQRAAARASEAIEELERRAATVGSGIDPQPLRQRLKAMQPALAEAAAIGEKEAELARRQGQFEDRLNRLVPSVAEKDRLWSWREPPEEALAEAERRFGELDTRAREDAIELKRLGGLIADANAALAAEAGEEGLVDEAVLARERGERDSLFEAIAAEPAGAAVKAYRKIVAQVDALADRRLAQAERLARRQVALHARERDEAALAALQVQDAALVRDREAAEQSWQKLFLPLGCEAGQPASMRRFLGDLTRLREERDALRELEARIEQARRRLAAERPGLEALAREAGLAGMAGQSLPSLLRLIDDHLGTLEQGAREARSLSDQLAAARSELARAGKAERQAQAVLEGMAAEWAEALGVLGLRAEATPQEAAKAGELWIAVQGKLAQLDNLEHRIASIRDDGAAFAIRAKALAEHLTPDETAEPAEIAHGLMASLATAREASARRRAARELLERCKAALAEAQAAQREHDDAIEALSGRAGCGAPDLALLADNLGVRAALRQDLAKCRTELALQGDGLDEAVLRAEVTEIGADKAAGEAEAVQAELTALMEADKQAALALGDLSRRREAIEREAGAAGAAQSLQDARSDLERITRDYLVVKTASLLIEAGLERQLKSEQGPLIARAGALFATMTGGSFAGIATLYDDDNRLRLAARRHDGNTTPIEGLSEGTRDQLYLALRLANLEGMAQRREVPPFIGDDLVMTFDEDRLAAALEVLALKGSSLQKILFTHHRHVVDIARDRLGEAVDVVTFGDTD